MCSRRWPGYDQQEEASLIQYYDLDDQTLWNPSNGVSRLFMSQVGVYQAELRMPSGIGAMQADECPLSQGPGSATRSSAGSPAWAVRTRSTKYCRGHSESSSQPSRSTPGRY
nr:DUF6086 family protein [Streptomyces sp. NRRL S-337]